MIKIWGEKSVECVGQIVFPVSIANAPIAELIRDGQNGETGRMTLRALTFWGVRYAR